MPSLPFLKKKKTTEEDLLELSYFVDRISIALKEEFDKSNIGKQTGYLSKTKTVAVLPSHVFPEYRNKLRGTKLDEFIIIDKYLGFPGATAVRKDTLYRVIEALNKEKKTYKILANKKQAMPLIITSENANIIISHMLTKY